jgi:hypothetical protein
LRFWVDLKSTVKKGDVGIREGTRLFFAINVIDKAELPNLQAQVQALGEKIRDYSDGKQTTKLEKWRALVSGYDEYSMAVAQWRTLGLGVPTPKDKVVDLGGLYAYSDGVVGLVRDNTGLFQTRRKQFGQAGTFTIRGQGDANPYIYDP